MFAFLVFGNKPSEIKPSENASVEISRDNKITTEPQPSVKEPAKAKLETPLSQEQGTEIKFYIGGQGMGLSLPIEKLLQACLRPFDLEGCLTMINGSIYFKFKVWDERKELIVRVDQSGAIVLPPFWDRNSNAKALEMVNGKGQPIFQLIRKAPFELIINGYLFLWGGPILATDNGIIQRPGADQIRDNALSAIFKYPSWKYPGEYAEK